VDVEDFADRLLAEGMDASTLRNTIMPLRVICKWHEGRGDIATNPTRGVQLPAVRGTRDRIASPDEAANLIAALKPADRALWGAAFYAGLRRGELQALRWSDIALASGIIRIERAWDVKEGLIDPKSRAGRRRVPIPGVLRDHLVEHRMLGPGDGYVFGSKPDRPFTPTAVQRRAETAWKRRGLEPITAHEARHTFASLMIASGVNAKALSTYMGHANISVTFDRYGHLMPGNENEAASLLDAYLERGADQARRAAVAA
jgi:integrase